MPSVKDTAKEKMPKWLKRDISINPFNAPVTVAEPRVGTIRAVRTSQNTCSPESSCGTTNENIVNVASKRPA